MSKRFWLIVCWLFAAVVAAAQGSTRVRGVVKDADTGEPIPFASVYFDGTTIGISTDMQGRYTLETRSPEARILTAQLIGYESLSIPVTQGSFSEINFLLKEDPKQISAALVKPNNRYIRSILRQLDRSRAANDPDNAPDWSTRLYSKIELDVTNAEDLLSMGVLNRNLGFVKQYSDTSAVTGKAFIPALISETLSDYYHSQNPSFQREVMRYNKISGFDAHNAIRQYTGSYLFRTNFYKNTLSVLNLSIPNPAASSSSVFYNYYLVDSLQVEGRKTYVLRFHPKKLVTSPALDGEMHIDAQDFGIRSVHASLSGKSNVNWIRHINMDIENRRTPEGRWFFDDERLFIDFSIAASDSSRILSFLGRRQLSYQPPVYGPITDPDALTGAGDVVERNVQQGSKELWAQERPYPLSSREQGIFDMVEDFQKTRFYKNSFSLLHTLTAGYYRIPSLGLDLGPWARTLSYNDSEGLRVQLGGRTYYDFSTFLRLSGHLAYGFKDKQFKGDASAEFLFREERTRLLTLSFRRDFEVLGSGNGISSVRNMFTSLASRSHANMQSMVRSFDIRYDHEFSPSVNTALEWNTSRLWSNPSVPFIRPDGSIQESFSANTLHAYIRFSKDERVVRNYFRKSYMYTKYPILVLDATYGFKGITPQDVSFLRTGFIVNWTTPSNAIGFGHLYMDGGAIWGSIPYPLLKLHEGNQTYFSDFTAFSCMNYYEFISDRWLNVFYEHNFNGFFLGKLPGISKLDLREVFTARMAWGTLSKANKENAPFLLPPGAGTLEVPYVELGVGISNILRVLRVDAFWRLTHRLEQPRRNFTINVGFDIDF